jgi:hypothetical protein
MVTRIITIITNTGYDGAAGGGGGGGGGAPEDGVGGVHVELGMDNNAE